MKWYLVVVVSRTSVLTSYIEHLSIHLQEYEKRCPLEHSLRSFSPILTSRLLWGFAKAASQECVSVSGRRSLTLQKPGGGNETGISRVPQSPWKAHLQFVTPS